VNLREHWGGSSYIYWQSDWVDIYRSCS